MHARLTVWYDMEWNGMLCYVITHSNQADHVTPLLKISVGQKHVHQACRVDKIGITAEHLQGNTFCMEWMSLLYMKAFNLGPPNTSMINGTAPSFHTMLNIPPQDAAYP